jgi:magnesium transporter
MRLKPFEKEESTVGLAPGTLVHVGEKKVEKVRIKLVAYNSEKIIEKELNSIEECLPFKDIPSTNLWINIDGLDQIEVIEKVGSYFDIHPLTLENILNTGQRPKMEDYESYVYAVLKIMLLDKKNDEIIIDQISIIFGYNFILSFQEREVNIFNPLRERLKNPASRLRKYGVDYLAYGIIDVVIDNYLLIIEQFGEEIEELEEELVLRLSPDTIKTIQKYKKKMIFLRRSVWPLRELINNLQKVESEIIADNTRIYLRDIYDHTIRVINSIEDFRDILTSMIDIYLSSVNNERNEVMRVLTVITTIFIILTCIAGLYAMNFDYMPELEWGYPAIILFMAFVGAVMLTYFRKKRWV